VTLRAFHNQQSIKDEYLRRVRSHQTLGNIVQLSGYYHTGDYHDYYFDRGNQKGSAVGATLEKEFNASTLAFYETELGIPRLLASLEDCIFAGSSPAWSKNWAERFLSSASPGADLSKVFQMFAVWLLVDEEHGVIKYSNSKRSFAIIRAVADAYQRLPVKLVEWNDLAWSAYVAAEAEKVEAVNEDYEVACNAEVGVIEAAAAAASAMANAAAALCGAELAHVAASALSAADPACNRRAVAAGRADLSASAASRSAAQAAYVAANTDPLFFDLIHKAYVVANSYFPVNPNDSYVAAYAAARAVYEAGGDDFEARAHAQAACVISDRANPRAPYQAKVATYAAYVTGHAERANTEARQKSYERQGENLLALMSASPVLNAC
jgi:hypothetical protein